MGEGGGLNIATRTGKRGIVEKRWSTRNGACGTTRNQRQMTHLNWWRGGGARPTPWRLSARVRIHQKCLHVAFELPGNLFLCVHCAHACVYVCVCVCARERRDRRDGREWRKGVWKKERPRSPDLHSPRHPIEMPISLHEQGFYFYFHFYFRSTFTFLTTFEIFVQ